MVKTKQDKWNKYFMDIAEVVRTRSDCLRPSVGAVLVNPNYRIIATGYNGAPKGIKNCNEGGCQRCLLRHKGKLKSGVDKDKCICVHAEENAIIQAAKEGTPTDGSFCYTTTLPCVHCAKIIIQAGIKSVFYNYHRDKKDTNLSLNLFKEAKIKLIKLGI